MIKIHSSFYSVQKNVVHILKLFYIFTLLAKYVPCF